MLRSFILHHPRVAGRLGAVLACVVTGVAASAVASATDDVSGTWQGVYHCGASKTDLSLTITHQTPERLAAEFSFRVLNGPHAGTQGRFSMLGSYGSQRREVRLKPAQMISMPPGFVATPVRGVVSADGRRLTGRIEMRGCSGFEAARAAGAAADKTPQGDSGARAAPERPSALLRQQEQARLSEALEREKASVDAELKGLLAVEMGRNWGVNFEKRYKKHWANPAVTELHARYLTQRNDRLRDATAELKALFESTNDSETLDAHERKYLNRQQDSKLEAGAEILGILDERRQTVRYHEEYSKYSAAEHALMMVPERLPLRIPIDYSEPEPEEINLAIMRELTSVGGRMLSGTAVEVGLPPFDLFMPMRLDSSKVEKHSCRHEAGGKAYTCDYRHFLTLSIPAVTYASLRMGGRSALAEELMEKAISEINSTEPVVSTHTFVLTTEGWRSPTMRKVVVDGAFKSYAEMLAAFPECELVERAGQLSCE